MRSNYGRAVQAGRIDGGVHFYAQSEASAERLRTVVRVSAERVERIRQGFVGGGSEDYLRFERQFAAAGGIGLVSGPVGCGRATAAIHVLSVLRPGVPIHEEQFDPDEKDGGIGDLAARRDAAYLIDLTHVDRPTEPQRAGMRAFIGAVRSAGTHLVLVCGPRCGWDDPDEGFARLHLSAPPDPSDVFVSALRVRGCAGDVSTWLEHKGVAEALDDAPPGTAVSLAEAAARERPDSPRSFAESQQWIESVLARFDDPEERVRDLFAAEHFELDREQRRLVLVVAALLNGAPVPIVAAQIGELTRKWEVVPAWRTPVSGEGFGRLLRSVDARVESDRVRFPREELPAAALELMWQEYPEARSRLLSWSKGAAEKLEREERAALARRWLALALRRRDPAPVVHLLDAWGQSAALVWSAIPVVAEAAVSPEIGAGVRAHLYTVASNGIWFTMRQRAVIEVCGIYGRAEPRTALTRLRHVAARMDPAWSGALTRAVGDVAEEGGSWGLVLDELFGWCEEPGVRAVARQCVAELLQRSPGSGQPPYLLRACAEPSGLEGAVVRAWTYALRGPDSSGRAALWGWLEAADRDRWALRAATAAIRGAADSDGHAAAEAVRALDRWDLAHSAAAPEFGALRAALAPRVRAV